MQRDKKDLDTRTYPSTPLTSPGSLPTRQFLSPLDHPFQSQTRHNNRPPTHKSKTSQFVNKCSSTLKTKPIFNLNRLIVILITIRGGKFTTHYVKEKIYVGSFVNEEPHRMSVDRYFNYEVWRGPGLHHLSNNAIVMGMNQGLI